MIVISLPLQATDYRKLGSAELELLRLQSCESRLQLDYLQLLMSKSAMISSGMYPYFFFAEVRNGPKRSHRTGRPDL